MASFIRSDLDFILAQIKISEAHAAGTPLDELVANPLLPYGLRTVDGTWNNLVPGQEHFGSADRVMPRVSSPPAFQNAENFDPDFGGPAPARPTSYAQTSGIVSDSQPRVVSNLISDQTANNPAAVEAQGATGGEGDEGGSLLIPNIAPDEGLSAPFNSWFTLFGQFFDHGLDLVGKGGSGTVFIPLQHDDPLYDKGTDGIAGTQDDGRTNFMVLTRATNQPGADGILGTADDVREHVNSTTPFVDQNQTYTSHASHQVFLREYALDATGRPQATGHLLEGDFGGPANWGEVKAQARNLLGIELDDTDVGNVPLLATDEYGRFLRGPNGYVQLVTPNGLVEGNPAAPVNVTAAGALRTGHAFLDDIAHTAAPRGSNGQALVADADAVVTAGPAAPGTYDDELLDAHFITGDGRGNENIGLTAVHHVFHAEHNRMVQNTIDVIEGSGDAAFIAEWKLPDGSWNGERLFQAARFGTEMQYQHLVFEEFARKVQPQVNLFAGYQTDIDPAIAAEFAHVVYRFGHSMLTETVARTDENGVSSDIGLIEAFLNPLAFRASGTDADDATAAIVRGMTSQVGNEIDEFLTGALRNNLVGLPLDLGALNIARGRETGVPSLNEARRQFHDDTGEAALAAYNDWTEFGLALRHPASLVNFVAAYGRHQSILDATTLEGKRAAALSLVAGVDNAGAPAPQDRMEFLTGTGAWANDATGRAVTGLEQVDFWIGGLAEKPMPFGGMLGSTFNFVFETQMERLQDGDRFYYLSRTAGLNFFTQLEENSFAELVMSHTGVRHLPFDIFSRPDHTIEASDFVTRTAPGVLVTFPDGGGQVLRMSDGTLRYVGGAHVVMGGTEGADRLRADIGDDTLWGDGGNDRLEGGAGNDSLNGGDGDDIITDTFGDDNIKGGAGDDVISAGAGIDLILAGDGRDFVVAGSDPKETFAGAGDDFVFGGNSSDTVFGNEGNDWIEGGDQADLLQGDNGDPFQVSTVVGHDVIIGGGGNDDHDAESGDDIMVAGPGIERNEGMLGFDWVIHKGDPQAADADLRFTGLLPPTVEALRDRYDLVEGVSGWRFNDVLRGDDRVAADMADHELFNVSLIQGLQGWLGSGVASFTGGNILLGGAGSDILEGRGGDDRIDGDAWMNVRISVRDRNNPELEIATADTMAGLQARLFAGTFSAGQLRIVRELMTGTAGTDTDTVQFSGALADYDITRDGVDLVVAHARGTATDGTDRVRNVERLQFADGTVLLSGTNAAAQGRPTVSDTTPQQNQVLTASLAGVTDANGIVQGSVQWFWQAETAPDVWAEVGQGVNYTPLQAQVDLPLRVLARYTDLAGNIEEVLSAVTQPVANVNDAPTGQPVVSDASPTEGQALTVDLAGLSDADGLTRATFGFQWQSAAVGGAFTNVAGATSASFTPGAAMVGRQLRVQVSYTDDRGAVEQLVSAVTTGTGDQVIGNAVNNTFAGTAFDDDLRGEGGNDVLNGNAGSDRLAGGDGADTLNGGAGADLMDGGTGNDTYVVDNAADTVVELPGQGIDLVQTTLASHALAAEVENLTYTGVATVAFTGTGNGLDNVIRAGAGGSTLDGGEGADTLVGGNGVDVLRGGDGNDLLTGGAGSDILDGGAGNDSLSGGTGNDTYVVDSAADVIVVAGETGGTDLVLSSATSYVLVAGVENLSHQGTGATAVTGNAVANVLEGGAGGDTFLGLGGNDTLRGLGGHDVLQGGDGNDTVDGGDGDDQISGGAGVDRLTGGAGSDALDGGLANDVFVFGAGFGADAITGFDANPTNGQDLLDLSALVRAVDFATRVSVTDLGADLRIDVAGEGSIVLSGVGDPAQVNATDFLLGA